MYKHIVSVVILLAYSVSYAQSYPKTKKQPLKITIFDKTYQDDYQWLENVESEEVSAWTDAQNKVADSIFAITTAQYNIEYKIKEYNSLSSNSLPARRGKYYYTRLRKDHALPASLFYKKSLDEPAIEIVNPYKTTKNKKAAVGNYYPSPNTMLLAYLLTQDGSDRNEIRFANFPKVAEVSDVLTNVKFSSVAWNREAGIFYKRNSNTRKFDTDSTYQLFYHRIGTPQSDDKLVFDSTGSENRIQFQTSDDKLIITETNEKSGNVSYYKCGLQDESFMLDKFIDNDTTGIRILRIRNNRVYFASTEFDWGEVRSFDFSNRNAETVVIPQIYMHLLEDTYFYNNYIICKYKTAGRRYLSVYREDGTFIRKFDAPAGMDFNVNFLNYETKELFVSFYSYVISAQNFRLNIETGDVRSFYNDFVRPMVTLFPLDHFVTRTITYKSRDNKEVPITIVHKKTVVQDGTNPTLLEAYGGFGTVDGPHYDTALLYFLEKGGVYAYADIRGSGEKGLKWYRDGKTMKKMNSFNDFIDAAEFLISEKYTSSSHLAITGASNGGLLVGAVMTLRPDLFKVAIPAVGLHDMMRFGKYSAGKFWVSEYGDVNIKEGFEYMYNYSPYHNIKEDVNYPITLILTSENDDRVAPFHSYKFAARLQERAAQKNPIYLKTERNAGHSVSLNSSYNDRVRKKAEVYSFLLHHLK